LVSIRPFVELHCGTTVIRDCLPLVEVTGIVHWPLLGARIETVSSNTPSSFFLLALSRLPTKLSRYGVDDVEGVIEGSSVCVQDVTDVSRFGPGEVDGAVTGVAAIRAGAGFAAAM
jgi:hypothetical protein